MNHVLDYISYLSTGKSLYQHQIQAAQFYLIVYFVFALVYTYPQIPPPSHRQSVSAAFPQKVPQKGTFSSWNFSVVPKRLLWPSVVCISTADKSPKKNMEIMLMKLLVLFSYGQLFLDIFTALMYVQFGQFC